MDIRNKYTLILINKFEALQEISEKPTPNDEYENFVNAHLEAAAECIPTKQRAKPRVLWETLAVIKSVQTWNPLPNPTNTNALKPKKAENELANIYLIEQIEFLKIQINTIWDSVGDRQSRIAWQTINEVSRKKNSVKAELKATTQEDRIYLRKQHFENLSENLRKLHMNQSQKMFVDN